MIALNQKKRLHLHYKKQELQSIKDMENASKSPITWVPSVYFAMGLPFVVLNMVSVLMFKGMGISDWDKLPFGLSFNHDALDH